MTVTHGEEALPGMLRALDAAGITMESIQLARPTLDDVFLTLTGRSLRDDSPAGQSDAPDQDPGDNDAGDNEAGDNDNRPLAGAGRS
jgi:ABC-2 type transport system ATP-binding protein